LKFVEKDYDEIHFFGDKCYDGGNDYEIYIDKRTIGHEVKDPSETIKILKDLF
jgi:phosphomannomutase